MKKPNKNSIIAKGKISYKVTDGDCVWFNIRVRGIEREKTEKGFFAFLNLKPLRVLCTYGSVNYPVPLIVGDYFTIGCPSWLLGSKTISVFYESVNTDPSKITVDFRITKEPMTSKEWKPLQETAA